MMLSFLLLLFILYYSIVVNTIFPHLYIDWMYDVPDLDEVTRLVVRCIVILIFIYIGKNYYNVPITSIGDYPDHWIPYIYDSIEIYQRGRFPVYLLLIFAVLITFSEEYNYTYEAPNLFEMLGKSAQLYPYYALNLILFLGSVSLSMVIFSSFKFLYKHRKEIVRVFIKYW